MEKTDQYTRVIRQTIRMTGQRTEGVPPPPKSKKCKEDEEKSSRVFVCHPSDVRIAEKSSLKLTMPPKFEIIINLLTAKHFIFFTMLYCRKKIVPIFSEGQFAVGR